MDLIEAQNLKQNLENDVKDLLIAFENNTGLSVTRVSIETVDVSTISHRTFIIKRVEIECKLRED
jgi:hypothetical protein